MSSGLREKERGITISFLSDFLFSTGKEWDWDDYTSLRLNTPELEAIRRAALAVDLPVDDEGRKELESLLDQARRL